MKNQLIKSGIFPKKCPDGSDGTMVATFSWPTNQKLVGNSFQTEVSIQLQILHTVNTLQNMFTTIICTLMLMNSQDNAEERKALLTVNSYPLDSSHLRINGFEKVHHVSHEIYLNFRNIQK